MWRLEMSHKEFQPSEATTFNYVVRRTQLNEPVEPQLHAPSLDDDEHVHSEVLEDEDCVDDSFEEIVLAHNHRFFCQQHEEDEAASIFAAESRNIVIKKEDGDATKDPTHSTTSGPPPSPTGVEQEIGVTSSVFSTESMASTTFFPDTFNPFRASVSSNEPKFRTVKKATNHAAPSAPTKKEVEGRGEPRDYSSNEATMKVDARAPEDALKVGSPSVEERKTSCASDGIGGNRRDLQSTTSDAVKTIYDQLASGYSQIVTEAMELKRSLADKFAECAEDSGEKALKGGFSTDKESKTSSASDEMEGKLRDSESTTGEAVNTIYDKWSSSYSQIVTDAVELTRSFAEKFAEFAEETEDNFEQNERFSQAASSCSFLPSCESDAHIQIADVMTSKLRLNIDDFDESFFRKLMTNLSATTGIHQLDIRRSNGESSERKRTAQDMELFFQVVRSLTNLQTLHLYNLDAAFDLQYFHDAVFGHRKLQFVQLHLMRGGIDTATLQALNTSPCLTELSLKTPESFDFSYLLRSPTLRRLHIASSGSFAFENGHIMAMVPMLECNPILMELDLEPTMSFLAFKFLAYSMRINRSVQVLHVAIDPTASQQLVKQAMDEIAAVLAMNQTLRVLNNANHRELLTGVSSRRRILRALEANLTMEHFQLFLEDATFAHRKQEILRPADTSIAAINRSFSDGTTYRSFMNSFYTQDSTSYCGGSFSQEMAEPMSRFCGSLGSIDLNIKDMVARETKRCAAEVKKQFSVAIGSVFGKKRESKESAPLESCP